MTQKNIFCYADDRNKDGFQQKKYRAFNKEVGEERYCQIVELITDDILKDLELDLSNNSWEKEWEKVTNEQWKRMEKEIPEFDKEVVAKIIGLGLFTEEYGEDTVTPCEEVITLNGVKYKRID